MVQGFKASGIVAGIKKKKLKDLGLIVSDIPASVAGVFTKNQIKAAPVVLDMKRIVSGTCQAVIVNSGNANCCNGEAGMADAVLTAKIVAEELGILEEAVLVSSTGVIGEPMPMDAMRSGIPDLIKELSEDGFLKFAEAIMTTDTKPKLISKTVETPAGLFSITGVAKGAGMIRPDMATMLSYVCTDVVADQVTLNNLLIGAVNKSYNRITIDGDTSTNDTVLILANGMSGVSLSDPENRAIFQRELDDMLVDLAKKIIKDGEGATKLVEIIVRGAASVSDAHKIADTIANSNLVKTAFFGEDANWGRIVGALGRAGVPVNPDTIDIYFNDVQMVKNGMGCGKDVEADATAVLKLPEFEVVVDLNMGNEAASCWTCDFSIDYVKINADYRS